MRHPLRLQKDLVHITVALNIYSFAVSLVGVFIPLVILKGGQRLWEVPAFYLIYALCKLCINFPVIALVNKKGAHVGVGLAFIAGALQMVSIAGFTATHVRIDLLAGAVSMALTNAFLWNSQHLFISKAMHEHSKSSSMATIAIVGQVSGVVAPLIGGLIGAAFGSTTLLAVAIALCIMALIPLKGLVSIGRQTAQADLNLVYNFSGAPARDILANFCFNLETAVGVFVWPVYLAVSLATYRSIGFISSLASIVAVVVTWLAGRRGDQGKDRAVLREGVIISSFIDVTRIAVNSQFWIAAVSSAYNASLAYFGNAWSSTYYHHAKKHGIQYIASMEIACDLAYVAMWGILLLTLSVASQRAFFTVAFIIAAVAGWGCLFITKQGNFESVITKNDVL